jgi:hypothetical protein
MTRTLLLTLMIATALMSSLTCTLTPGESGSSGTASGGGLGTLVLSLAPGNLLVARTIAPVGTEIGYFRIEASGPEGAGFLYDHYEAEILVEASLVPGLWTIAIEAYNNADVLVGGGKLVIPVAAGQIVRETIVVNPLDGFGTLEIKISWPKDVLTDPQLVATLTPAGGVPEIMGFGVGKTIAYYYSDTIERGYYMVSLRLEDEGETVWGTVEAARIVAGALSTQYYELVEDVNRGGVEIVPDMQNPIDVSIEGVPPELAEGQAFIAFANTFDVEVDSYQWYLRGRQIGTDSPNVTVSGLLPDHYWLNVVLTNGPVLSSATAEFSVIRSAGSM